MRNYLAVITLLFSSCFNSSSVELSSQDYVSWFSESDLIKEKKTEFVTYKASYLPSQLLAIRDIQGIDSYQNIDLDSIINSYNQAYYFELKIINENNNVNLIKSDVDNYLEYQEKVNSLNFRGSEFFKLSLENEEYFPILTHFEGLSELSNQATFIVAFNKNLNKNHNSNLVFSFEDPYWQSGTNHFTFSFSDIENGPKLIAEK